MVEKLGAVAAWIINRTPARGKVSWSVGVNDELPVTVARFGEDIVRFVVSEVGGDFVEHVEWEALKVEGRCR
jgi:hypothetical protein